MNVAKIQRRFEGIMSKRKKNTQYQINNNQRQDKKVNGNMPSLKMSKTDDLRSNDISSDSKITSKTLTFYEKVQQNDIYKFGRRSVFVNTLRVSLVLLLIVAFFFCFVSPHNSIISLEANWDIIDQIKARGISLKSFEVDSIVFSDYDALVFSIEKGYVIVYNNTEYDDSYTFVLRPASTSLVCSLERSSFNYYLEGWQSPLHLSASDSIIIPSSSIVENEVVISGDFEYNFMYYDQGIGKDYNLTISNNGRGTSYQFYRNEPCYISGFIDSLCVDIYKGNELVVDGKEDGSNIEIPMMRGIISTYGQGNIYLSKIKSCNIELQNSKKILFTGSGSMQYYYTAEGKTDSFEHYDIEMESKEGFNSTLIIYDEKTTKLHVTGEAENMKYFGRSLFPSGLEWLRMNAWTLPISLITIIGAGVSLTKKDP